MQVLGVEMNCNLIYNLILFFSGMEDWVLESQHYGYYKEGASFSVNIEKEILLTFPQYLNIYTFEENNDSRFPSPKKGSTGVLGWFNFNWV